MVQILNKMIHLKYPILEIWLTHKHITQLLSRYHGIQARIYAELRSIASHCSLKYALCRRKVNNERVCVHNECESVLPCFSHSLLYI